MRKPHEKEIDGVEYLMYEMNPFKSSALLARLLKLLGKPVSKFIQGIDKKEGQSIMEADFNQEMIGLAIEELSTRLHEKEVEKLMKDLLVKDLITYKDSEAGMEEHKKILNVESHFGKYTLLHLFKVVKFALEVNFEDFFGGLAELKE